jgi:hypothetical protein
MTTENRTSQATTGGDGDALSTAWIDRLLHTLAISQLNATVDVHIHYSFELS